MFILNRIYLTYQIFPLPPLVYKIKQVKTQKNPKNFCAYAEQKSFPHKNSSKKKKSKIFKKLTPLQSIFYLCQFSLNLLKS
jgi:hypothetical protein